MDGVLSSYCNASAARALTRMPRFYLDSDDGKTSMTEHSRSRLHGPTRGATGSRSYPPGNRQGRTAGRREPRLYHYRSRRQRAGAPGHTFPPGRKARLALPSLRALSIATFKYVNERRSAARNHQPVWNDPGRSRPLAAAFAGHLQPTAELSSRPSVFCLCHIETETLPAPAFALPRLAHRAMLVRPGGELAFSAAREVSS
jgi:hypothetical protein